MWPGGKRGPRILCGEHRRRTHQVEPLEELHIERLDKVQIEASLSRPGAILIATVAADGDQQRMLGFRLRAHAARDRVAVRTRHADIQQYEIGMELSGNLQCFRAIQGGPDSMAPQHQQRRSAIDNVRVVIDHQNLPCPARIVGCCLLAGR